MLNYVQTISIQVNDQDNALDFYVNVLGFEKISDQPMDEKTRWIVVAPPGAQTGIVLAKGYGPGQVREPGGFTGFIFNTDDIEATYETLQARGVNFTAPPRAEPWGKWAQFADPDGNEFGIWAPVNEG
ncbi:MAG: VOC family protein [Chloroflexota bacterium]